MRKIIPKITNKHVVKGMIQSLSAPTDIEFFRNLTDNQYSHNSLLAIQSDWHRYTHFCQKHHISVLPASITAIRRFLETESQHRKFASLKRYTATISLIHTILDLPNPVNHRQTKFTLNQLQSLKHGDAKQTNAFTRSHLSDLNALLARSPSVKDIRDLAIYNLMFECVLKRSELKHLVMSNLRLEAPNRIVVLIGDQAYALSQDSSHYVYRWLSHLSNKHGAVFRSIDRHGNISNDILNDSSIYRILRNASVLLDIPEHLQFSGQSLRVGAAKELSKQGMKIKEVQDFGRWLSPAMPSQYIGYRSIAEKEMFKFKLLKPWD